MGRNPCCPNKEGMNRGAWTALEDKTLVDYIKIHGEGKWRNIPKESGLKRCGKSCRLRWLNYLRPGIKRGNISKDEEDLIIRLHRLLGNRWSLIAGRLPGRTDNEIKNYWNSNLAKQRDQGKKQKQKHKRTKFLSELISDESKEKNMTAEMLSGRTSEPPLAPQPPPPRVPEVKLVKSDVFMNSNGTVAECESSDVSSPSLSRDDLSPEVVPDIDLSGILETDFSMFGDAGATTNGGDQDWSGLECVQDIDFLMSSEFGSMASMCNTEMNGLFGL